VRSATLVDIITAALSRTKKELLINMKRYLRRLEASKLHVQATVETARKPIQLYVMYPYNYNSPVHL